MIGIAIALAAVVALVLVVPRVNARIALATVNAYAEHARRAREAGDRERMERVGREAIAFCDKFKVEGEARDRARRLLEEALEARVEQGTAT
ncbi:MAG TPA: hypothetical protein VHF22_14155 [Planctomycetota bacterium]|nr:hypothetical protein [Planctomycetota bacterium]